MKVIRNLIQGRLIHKLIILTDSGHEYGNEDIPLQETMSTKKRRLL
jgi:hypothetical protein